MKLANQSSEMDTEASAPLSLYRLLANYWDRYDLLTSAMDAADATARNTPEREAAEKAQDTAGHILDEATSAILAYVPTWIIEAKAKHNFVEGLEDRNGGLSSNEVMALLSSLPTLIDAKVRREAA